MTRIGSDIGKLLPEYLNPHNGSGRFAPVYWLFHVAEFVLFGFHFSLYYLTITTIFTVGALLAFRLVYRNNSRTAFSFILLPLIYLSSPVAENLNTIGKPEPIVFLAMTAIIAIFSNALQKGRRLGLLPALAILAIFVISLWTKETTITLLVFAGTGVCTAWLFRRTGAMTTSLPLTRRYLILLGIFCLGVFCAKLPALTSHGTNAATYTQYPITLLLIKKNLFFYITQQPDVIFFGLFSTICLAVVGRRIFISRQRLDDEVVRNYVLYVSLCMTAWAYYMGLLIWRWPMGYYMLISAIFFKMASVYVVAFLWNSFVRRKVVAAVAFTPLFICVLIAAAYEYYIVTSQITYNLVYTEAMRAYQERSADRHPLLMESYPFFAEQVIGSQFLLESSTNRPATIHGISDILDPAALSPEMIKMLGVSTTDIDRNYANLPRDNDYVLVITGQKLATWFLRAVTPYYSLDSLLKTQHMYRMDLVAENTITVPAIYLNLWTFKLAATRTSIGYKLYRAHGDAPKYLWRGRYPDGWMGSTAELTLNPDFNTAASVRISTPKFVLPNHVDILKNGVPFKSIDLVNTDEVTVALPYQSGETVNYHVTVARTASPSKLRLSRDNRQLGIRISLGALPDTSH